MQESYFTKEFAHQFWYQPPLEALYRRRHPLFTEAWSRARAIAHIRPDEGMKQSNQSDRDVLLHPVPSRQVPPAPGPVAHSRAQGRGVRRPHHSGLPLGCLSLCSPGGILFHATKSRLTRRGCLCTAFLIILFVCELRGVLLLLGVVFWYWEGVSVFIASEEGRRQKGEQSQWKKGAKCSHFLTLPKFSVGSSRKPTVALCRSHLLTTLSKMPFHRRCRGNVQNGRTPAVNGLARCAGAVTLYSSVRFPEAEDE